MGERVHRRAVEISGRYLRAEAELIEVLQQVEEHRVFMKRGHSSLFNYVVQELGLSESVTFNLIAVARKSREVPELKVQIAQGAITLSNARKIAPVLTQANQGEWLTKAAQLSHRQLEKEVVKIRPLAATTERVSYVTPHRVKMELGLSEKDMLDLRRAQDLLSRKQGRPARVEDLVMAMTQEYLDKHDPVRRAQRIQVKKGTQEPKSVIARKVIAAPTPPVSEVSPLNPTVTVRAVTLQGVSPQGASLQDPPAGTNSGSVQPVASTRTPIPAAIRHQVSLRDEGRCAHTDPQGKRCNQSRWVEIHHKTPVSQGGTHALTNLITLCSTHHDYWHERPGEV
jgi:hypothetical protein